MRGTMRLIIATLLIFTGVNLANAERRVALVIGNSGYKHVPELTNPGNDARDIAGSFERLGFEVTRLDNLDFSGMRRALGTFSQKSHGADMAVVFYAGHGMEVNHQNYLIPTDARLETDLSVSYEAVPLELVTEAVASAKGLKLVILDACRNNPFAASMKLTNQSRSIGRGLARVEPADGTLVAFAAKEGTVASDGGNDRNSPYTKALLAHLEQPGLEVNFLFRKVRDHVMRETDKRQQPFTYGSLPGRAIYLQSAPSSPAAAGAQGDERAAKLEKELKELQKRLDEAERRQARVDPASPTASAPATETETQLDDDDGRSAAELTSTGVAAYNRQDFEKAARSFRRAARMGHAQAQFGLAQLYSEGRGVAKNFPEAVKWWRRSAENGFAGAQYNLAWMYHHGRGVTQDLAQAAHWYRKAADQGDAKALHNLANMYGNGLGGLPQDQRKAAELVSQALRAGDAFTIKEMQTNGLAYPKSFRIELQRILKRAGVYKGVLDGSFGPATRAAIRRYAEQG